MDKKSWNGRWWLPEDPDNKQPGILTRDAGDDLRLELVGGFNLSFSAPMDLQPDQKAFYDRTHVPLIVGETEHGPVSLLDCLSLGSGPYRPTLRNFLQTKAGIDAPDYHRFAVQTGLIGTALESVDQPAFTQLRIQVENLIPFLGSLQTFAYRNDARTSIELQEIHGSTPREFDGLQFKVAFEQSAFYEFRQRNKVDILSTLTPAITVTSPEPTTYAKIDRYTKSIMDLLTIATNEPCGTLSETLDENVRNADTVTIIEDKIFKARSSRSFNGTWLYRFTCDDIPFEQLIERWLELRAKVGPAIDLLLAPVYSSRSYHQEKLLDIAAAAETFHTRIYDFDPRPQEEFDQLVASMLSGVESDQDKQWIKSRFSNTPSYAKRLRDLLKHPDQEAINIVVPEPSKWARNLTDMRNILAHGKDEPLPPLLDCQILLQQTVVVIVLNILHQLGIGKDRQMAVASDAELAHLRKQARVRDLLGS